MPENPYDDMFYWWFPSRRSRDSDPLVIWLTGGPGCSSEYGLFIENGPFLLQDTGNGTSKLVNNPYSWNNQANLLFVDQPIGTGFSHSTQQDLKKNETQVAADFLYFIEQFMEKYPEFKGRPLFVTGESYGGHYVPYIANAIRKAENFDLDLKGVAIGNGMVTLAQQELPYATYALHNGLINNTVYLNTSATFLAAEAMLKSNNKLTRRAGVQLGYKAFGKILNGPDGNPRFDVYDIRKKADDDQTFLTNFMNRDDVQASLGVQGRRWTECNMTVNQVLALDDMYLDCAPQVAEMLEAGIQVHVYSGDQDFICNWEGGVRWSQAMTWSGQAGYKKANFSPISYGQIKRYQNLRFIRVYGAGHQVPQN